MNSRTRLHDTSAPFFQVLRRQMRRCAGLAALLMAALMLSACSDGGGGSGSSGSDTGTVGVLLTDGPTDRFCSIMLLVNSVTLLSDDEHVTIFEGSRRVDLLDLRDNTELITVGRGVPAGTYSKIRLGIDDERVRLFEECDEDGTPSGEPKIARLPSGKIDLNPRGDFELAAGSLMLIQLDMDAEKSIHISGPPHNEKINFRPVVFVDIYTAEAPDRLVRLTGTIEELASDPDRFDLCRTHDVSRPVEGDPELRVMKRAEDGDNGDDDNGNGDDGDNGDRDTCVEVRVVDATSIFLAEAVPGGFGDLENGRTAAVLGRFVVNGENLRVVAEVVQQDPDTVERVGGVIASELVDSLFDLEVSPDRIPDLPENLIAVLLQTGTKVFSRRGELLDPAEDFIQVGHRARVFGYVDLSTEGEEQINASLVVVDTQEGALDRVSGPFVSWDEATREMRLDADPDLVCVPEGAAVFLGMPVDDRIVFEESDPSEFSPDTGVTAFGRADDDTECPEATFEASSVIGFEGED
jgi:hypothetical protein